jgi:branched-chain amino acid aminotransferase
MGHSGNIRTWKFDSTGLHPYDMDGPDFDALTLKLPSGLYTTFRTYGGRMRVLGLRAHLRRLYAPAASLGVRPAVDAGGLRRELADLLAGFEEEEARVRLVLDTTSGPGTLFVMLQPLKLLPPEIYRNGVRTVTSPRSRTDPVLKQTSFIASSQPERHQVGGGIFEILLTHNGRILEGMTSNFFYVRDGVLCTAGRGVLQGVTRQVVTGLARRHGIRVAYRSLKLADLPSIREACITSSSRGLVPVVEIDGHTVGSGVPGSVMRALLAAYDAEVLALSEALV